MSLSWQPLWTLPDGRKAFFRDNEDGSYTVWSTQENDPLLDRNRAMANHNDGWSPTRELRREASIPMGLINKWKQEEGWDPLRPDLYGDKLSRRLNDIDWMYLRTSPGKT